MIDAPVVFSPRAAEHIAKICATADYSHSTWGDDSLEFVRCEVRDHYRVAQRLNCVYCRNPIAARSAFGAPVEHIAPKSMYLSYMFEPLNLCVCCPDCNEYKGNREVHAEPPVRGKAPKAYPLDAERFRIIHPHFDHYDQHIRKAGFIYIPLTEKGSYTSYVCNLSRYVVTMGLSEDFYNDLQTLADRHRFHECN